jgi:uncharacterized membrane protein YfcA
MGESLPTLIIVCVAFLLGGLVKGVLGLGLPTAAIGVLGLVMTPARAAALLAIPTFVTNVWQFAAGPHLGSALQRIWALLLGICVGTFAGLGQLTGEGAGRATVALGIVLVLYALMALATPRFSVPRRAEPWLSPVIGVVTGLITAATGLMVIPSVPYLQALGLPRDELVQALGLSFTVSTVALAAVLAYEGVFETAIAGASLLALAPAVAGMLLGQLVRSRVSPRAFRLCFLLGLLLVGAHLALRPLL